MASSYIPLAASGDNSRNGEPGSIRFITRSRGSSLPRDTWRSRDCSEPPSAAWARRACNSAVSAPMFSALARNSALPVSMADDRIANLASPIPTLSVPRPQGEGNGGENRACQETNRNVGGLNAFPIVCGQSGGIQRRIPMRKLTLLSTAAAVMLIGTAAASAQGMKEEEGPAAQAPTAQQKAPAEKMAPSIKSGQRKTPETTGQASPDVKSGERGKTPQTTGQAPSKAS